MNAINKIVAKKSLVKKPLVKKQLLLIHGWGVNKGIWFQLEHYLSHEIKLISLDLPGYGDSDTIPIPYTVNSIAKQLADYLDQAQQSIVLGWSMGGLIAIEMANLYPHKISQLILVASNPQFVQADDWPYAVEKQLFINFSTQLKQDIKKTIKRFIAIQTMGSETARTDIKKILKLIDKQGYAHYSILNKGLEILLTCDQRQTLLDLKCPTLMIAGDRDSLVNIKGLNYLTEKAKHLSLVSIKGAGHAPFISHFEQFTHILKNNLYFE